MDRGMEALLSFLRRRDIGEENITKLQNDKIDTSVIESMEDKALAAYIPIYGDRIATRRFCSEYQRKGEKDVQRQSLLQKLRRKMGIDQTFEEPDKEEPGPSSRRSRPHMKNNKIALRQTRKVELGWFHEGKQQKKNHGGGTRRLDVPKDSKKADILQMALDLFFPKGTSKKGKMEEFSVDILDFQEDAVLDEDVTVGELYSVLKMGMLRFYLCTKLKESTNTQDSVHTEQEPTVQGHREQAHTVQGHREQEHTVQGHREQAHTVQGHREQEHTEEERMEEERTKEEHTEPNGNTQPEDQNVSLSSSTSEVIIGAHIGEPLPFQLDDTVPIFESDEEEHVILTVPTATPDTVIIINQCSSSDPTASTTEPHNVIRLTPSPSFSPGGASTPTNANSDLTDNAIANIHIKIHRANLLDELISQFIDPNLLTSHLTFGYINEIGADATGVSRDVYAAFWTEFYDYATEGQDMRVPILSPKRKEEEWKSIGRILMKGFQDHGYFPCRIAQAFTVALLFGEKSVTSDLLFESFLSYISMEERDLVNKALQEDLDDEEKEELIDFLDRMGAKSIPAKDNLKATLLSVAHKLIIQQPKYALDKMSEVVGSKLRRAFGSLGNIQQIYENVKPTTKKVLKLLEASPSTQAEHQSLRYLQQYIRGLDPSGLRKFLRFTTGSDALCVNKLEIMFTPLDGVERRPVAHTCGPALELPWTYMSFPELRVEFDHILNSDLCFVMDIA